MVKIFRDFEINNNKYRLFVPHPGDCGSNFLLLVLTNYNTNEKSSKNVKFILTEDLKILMDWNYKCSLYNNIDNKLVLTDFDGINIYTDKRTIECSEIQLKHSKLMKDFLTLNLKEIYEEFRVEVLLEV